MKEENEKDRDGPEPLDVGAKGIATLGGSRHARHDAIVVRTWTRNTAQESLPVPDIAGTTEAFTRSAIA